ncbi:MAG: glycoside hydrolase family 25 protein, partial [Campylobacterota bacterium]|nr:glycoside hydrolase family 25 protein [Campylobacterota bacterium]
IKTTTSRSFTDSSLSKGRYYYKIVALNSNSTSKDSGYRSQLITGDEKSIYGVDVSDNNGYISWSTAKSKGIQFAFIRSTEGYADSSWPESSAYDSRFEQNMQNAINYGMIVGIYHLARPDFNKGTSEAKKEAQYFVSKIKYYYQNHKLLPPVIDIEKTSNYYSKQTLTDWVVAFAKEVESQLGIKPIIYMNENYYYYKLYPSQLSQYKLWIARTLYNENSGVAINTLDDLNKYDSYFKPSVSNWTFWQYSWTGTNINSKNMDRNVFNGSLEDLKNLTVQVTATTKSYTFQNRWKTYINATLNNNSKWVLIKDTMYSSNAYKICQANDNTKCLHTQYGYLRSSSIGSDWKSARWTFENVDGTHIRIKNLYHTNKYIHIENGYLEASSIQSGWWSAHWKPI